MLADIGEIGIGLAERSEPRMNQKRMAVGSQRQLMSESPGLLRDHLNRIPCARIRIEARPEGAPLPAAAVVFAPREHRPPLGVDVKPRDANALNATRNEVGLRDRFELPP